MTASRDPLTPADLAAIEDVVHRAEHGPYESLTKLHNAMIAATPALLAEVRRLELAVSGYRRDVDNCLMELKARNTAIRDREVEISRLQSDNERMRRGLAVAVERGKQNTPFGACVIAENLLAGREWSEAAVLLANSIAELQRVRNALAPMIPALEVVKS